jgi:hypothetical protein
MPDFINDHGMLQSSTREGLRKVYQPPVPEWPIHGRNIQLFRIERGNRATMGWSGENSRMASEKDMGPPDSGVRAGLPS